MVFYVAFWEGFEEFEELGSDVGGCIEDEGEEGWEDDADWLGEG